MGKQIIWRRFYTETIGNDVNQKTFDKQVQFIQFDKDNFQEGLR